MEINQKILNLPIINNVQKIVIYETKARFYVVGSNILQTKFRILKIDRTEPRDLIISDDQNEYSRKEIYELLNMIEHGNKPKPLKYNNSGSTGLHRTISAFGIVGFVRFLEGYYMVLITKRRRVSLIGPYTIFKVEDTVLLPIPNEFVKYTHPDEQRYVKMFQNVDLSSNFYFSYAYDLTQTLQYNLTPCKNFPNKNLLGYKITKESNIINKEDITTVSNKNSSIGKEENNFVLNSFNNSNSNVEEASIILPFESLSKNGGNEAEEMNNINKDIVLGIRNEPYWKFVWNKFLLDPVINNIQNHWLLFLIHGFIGQSNICIFGKSIYLTLIARRSNKFAGTRFLKRGSNINGHVANEVETEQIVFDASFSHFNKINFTSYVQLRGSIPLHWSQDIAKIVPKPTISIDQGDVYGQVAGQHFDSLFTRYGSPIIVFDLVKRKEKKKHESLISDEFSGIIKYFNKFLPVEHQIQHERFDMAKANKAKNSNVLQKLSKYAESYLKNTNFFNSSGETKQHGVVRTNCVDCLDRTNTAQFAIGKHALELQLYALGVIESPKLEFDTDCLVMFEELYEDAGDTLALQYGGSQLVHRIKGYRKVSPWASSSRDIMQTLSRYCRNTFSDNEKQQAINLFLGIFRPQEGRLNIWDLTTDFYLHNVANPSKTKPYTQWYNLDVIKALPKPFCEESKCLEKMMGHELLLASDEKVNTYFEYYCPYEITSFDEFHVIKITNSIRDYAPKYSDNLSAFIIRKEWTHAGNKIKFNKDSSGSTGSDSGTSTSDDDECILSKSDDSIPYSLHTMISFKTFVEIFKKSDKLYGDNQYILDYKSKKAYHRYLSLGNNRNHPDGEDSISYKEKFTTCNDADVKSLSMFKLSAPSKFSMTIYENYIKTGKYGPRSPSKQNQTIYRKYLTFARC